MARKQKREKICGIYCFEVIIPNKWLGGKYIGQSIDIYDRKQSHEYELKGKYHFNNKLQRFVSKYGIETLSFSILMKCPESELDFWEKWFIKSFDTYKTRINFNQTPGGESGGQNLKKCILQNMKTNEIVEFPSIKEFSEKYGISPHAISSLLSGKTRYIYDWYNPNGGWKPKYYNVISPDNQDFIVIESKVFEFCREHNLSTSGFNEMLVGNCNFYNGWHRPDSIKLASNRFRYGKFKLVSPEGNLYEGENITAFAKEHGLEQSLLNYVILGKRFHHKGWRKYEDGMELKPFDDKEPWKRQSKKRKDNRVNNVPKGKYKFINPNGEVISTDCLSDLAKQHNLKIHCLSNIWRNIHNKHRGWTKYKGDS